MSDGIPKGDYSFPATQGGATSRSNEVMLNGSIGVVLENVGTELSTVKYV
jgi:hypothetical protein